MIELIVLLTWAAPFVIGIWALRLMDLGGNGPSEEPPPPPDPGPPPGGPPRQGPRCDPALPRRRRDRDAVAHSAHRSRSTPRPVHAD